MRVLVCGSRHYTDYKDFTTWLTNINLSEKITCIISGGARGADTLAERYAHQYGIRPAIYLADWNKHGKAAGPIRNKQMLDEGKPDLVIAFLAPDSIGTKNMIEQAEKAGVPVKVINIA